MSRKQVEAFSLTHAQVLDGGTTFGNALSLGEDYDVYGVDQSTLEPDTGQFDNNGDDTTLSRWQWLNFATINVRAGYLSFGLISTITGRAIASSGAGASQILEMDLWHEDDFNVGHTPALIRMPSKDSDGNVKLLDIGLYKVNWAPFTFEGPQYKDGLKVNYAGTALFSNTDELGVAFPDGKKRIGKIISRGV